MIIWEDNMELTPHIDLKAKIPAYIQLYNYIREEIINNKIFADEQLPSVRKLANHLGVSRTTIENAYQQLIAEGYIYSKAQKGYYANKLDKEYLRGLSESYIKYQDINKGSIYEYDFKNEYVEEDNFNISIWKKHLNYVINYQHEELFSFGFAQGEISLIKAISRYVHRTRGVNANENNIVVGAGVQPLLNILSIILKQKNINEIAMEDPGFNRAKNVFLDNNIEILPLEVTIGGVNMKQLEESKVRLCYISPSHQFPTGTVMLIDTRSKLIMWAKKNKGYIIEDDYNSELRYEGQPIPAMKSLDNHNRVIYLGSFSTLLIPSIRISFMILPDDLMEAYQSNRDKYAQTASKIEQLALANMMATGDFEKHIRRIRNNYSKKSDYTIKIIQKYLKDIVEVVGINSGLNILLKLKIKKEEEEIVKELKELGINISGILEYTIKPKLNQSPILVLSFRGIKTEKIDEGILKLSKRLKQISNK